MTLDEIIRELGIPKAPENHHHVTHGRTQIDCPWCSPSSHKWRLGIRNDSHNGFCHCWTCGHHKLVSTLAESSGSSFLVVLRLLEQQTKRIREEQYSPRGKLALPGPRGPLLPAHRRYLEGRGFDVNKLIQLWDISGIGVASQLQWRIVIPFFFEGRIVSWLSRSISDNVKPPYISAKPSQETLDHKSLLYGEDYSGSTIIIQEGPLDVWAVGPGSVATCGIGWTKAQLFRMVSYPCRVVLFDNEPDAQIRALELCEELKVYPGDTYNVTLETGKDASRATKREVRELRRRFLGDERRK